jgi:excisionase family DNA binding protein
MTNKDLSGGDSYRNGKQPERLLPEKEAAAYLSMSRSKLAKMRMNGTGPRFVRIGRTIRCRKSDLEEFVRANTWGSTSQY